MIHSTLNRRTPETQDDAGDSGEAQVREDHLKNFTLQFWRLKDFHFEGIEH